MTWFDLLVIVTLGLSTIFALTRGLIRELIALICLAVAGVTTHFLSQPIGAMINADDSFLRKALLIIVLFAVMFVLVLLFTEGIRHKFIGSKIGRIDRVLGGIFGFLRGFVLIGLTYLIIDYYAEDGKEPAGFTNAATLPLAKASGQMLENIGRDKLPADYQPDPSPAGSNGA